MSKTKKTTDPHYELLYLISNKFTEDEVKPIADKIESIIVANGGEITYRENWGKKRLSYPVKHFAYGYYLLIEFDVLPTTLAKIERSIRMQHDVLRHQIVTRPVRTIDQKEKPKQIFFDEPKKETPTTPASVKPIKAEITTKEEIATEKPEELKFEAPSIATEEVVTTVPETEVKVTTSPAKTTKDNKASLEELDAKLDKILETNDLL